MSYSSDNAKFNYVCICVLAMEEIMNSCCNILSLFYVNTYVVNASSIATKTIPYSGVILTIGLTMGLNINYVLHQTLF